MNVRNEWSDFRVSMRYDGTDVNREAFADAVRRFVSRPSALGSAVGTRVLLVVEEVDVHIGPRVEQTQWRFAN